jgi:hypothetical protein
MADGGCAWCRPRTVNVMKDIISSGIGGEHTFARSTCLAAASGSDSMLTSGKAEIASRVGNSRALTPGSLWQASSASANGFAIW